MVIFMHDYFPERSIRLLIRGNVLISTGYLLVMYSWLCLNHVLVQSCGWSNQCSAWRSFFMPHSLDSFATRSVAGAGDMSGSVPVSSTSIAQSVTSWFKLWEDGSSPSSCVGVLAPTWSTSAGCWITICDCCFLNVFIQ